MKSIVKSITAILLTFAVLCAFAACENDKVNDNSDNQSSTTESAASSNSTESNASNTSATESTDGSASEESSKAPDENGSKKLLYKQHSHIGEEAEATTTYEYTEFGEIATETTLEKNESLPITTKYEYNDGKKLISVTTSYGERETSKTNYEYNDLGLLFKETQENDIGPREIVYTYDEDNRLINVKVTDGAESKYTYDEDGSYTIDKFLSDGSKLVYTYNDNGDIMSCESYDSTGKLTAKEAYTYDGQTAVKKSYENDELVATVKYYYDGENNLIKIASVDESGKETLTEEREYKLFDIAK